MAVVRRNADLMVADLLERLAGVDEFAEACTLVLDRVAGDTGLPRAVVAVRSDAGVRGVAWGLDDARLQGFLAEAEEPASPLMRALRADGKARPLEPEARERLGFRAGVAVPIADGDRRPVGVATLDGEPGDARVAEAEEVLRRCGPALARALLVEAQAARLSKLERQRNLLTTIFDALPDPVLLTNPRNDILLANRRADQLFSAGPDDSEGRRRAIQVNNLLFSSFLTRAVISREEARNRELNLVDPSDGSDLLFEVLSAPLPSAAGEGSVISILRDITDLKRALTELESQFNRSRAAEHGARHERDQLNVVLENVGDPILVTDEQSNLILMNREAERLFVPAAEAAPDGPERRIVRANDTKFSTLVSDFLLQDALRRVERIELADPDTGREFPAEVVSSKIVNARGEPTAIVSVLHDLTQVVENQRLASELQQLNDQLEERVRRATEELEERNRRLEWQSRELERASRLKSEFLANMSHELRTPINVVLGYTSLMRERIYGELTAQQGEALAKIYSTSQHLLELINDILDLSKIEAGKMTLHAEEVRLDELLGELTEAIEPMLREKAVEYRTELEEALPVLLTDRTKLKQILLNLLSNAVKFTRRGSVTVRAAVKDGDWVRIDVVDTGIGIRPDQLEAIFEDFRQLDQSHTREYGGTGLGLSITRKLLRLLGGRIHVQSTVGVGSTFSVELPVAVVAGRVDGDASLEGGGNAGDSA